MVGAMVLAILRLKPRKMKVKNYKNNMADKKWSFEIDEFLEDLQSWS